MTHFCPVLGRVPSIGQNELVIKATQTGIVWLRDGHYRKRYTGSNGAQVDINGKLFLKGSDYRKAVQKDVVVKNKKKSPAKNQSDLKKGVLCTVTPITVGGCEDTTITEPEKKRRKGGYTVNKVELRNRLLTYIRTQQGKKVLYFWTITFPAAITDQLAYQAFNTWLTTLRQKKALREYIWVAERQDGKRLTDPAKLPTNNIHFHIAIPHFMHIEVANRAMRVILSNFCKKGLMNYTVAQCKRYNGVELAKDRKYRKPVNFAIKKGGRSLANYLAKYVSKNDSSFDHLAWHNSRGFSNLFTGVTFTVEEFLKFGFKEFLFHKSIINNLFFMFFPWKTGPPDLLMNHLTMLNDYCQHHNN